MKKNKLPLFILLAILMCNQGHATLYPDQNNNTDPRRNHLITNKIITPNDLNGDTVISIQPGKYAILLGKEDTDSPVNIDIEHSQNKNKKIININSGITNNNFVINRGIIKGKNKSNFNFELISVQKGKFRNEGILEISGAKGVGINVTNTAELENKGEISVGNKAKGIFLNYNNSKFENYAKINVTGQESIGITGNKNKKANITSYHNGVIEVRDKATGVSLENKVFFKNEGQINVFSNNRLTSGSEAIGVNINSEDKNSFENYGIINVKGTGKNPYSGYNAKGIFINNQNGNALNFGIINADNNGIGVISKGYFTNSGTINADGKSVGINILKTNTVPIEKTVNTGVIKASGESYGIQAAGNANFENSENGKIYVSEGATGIVAVKESSETENGNVINKGNIFVSGDKSTGIQANDNRKITTTGLVEVDAGRYTAGIKASGKNSQLTNTGKIVHKGDEKNTSNAAVSQMKGTIENKGEIEVLSGKLSSGIAVGENSFGINSEAGKIKINEGTGIKIEKNGIGINKGEILLKNRTTTGISLSNSIFINDTGKIIGDEKGNAVISKPLTNNTVVLKNRNSVNGNIIGNTGIDTLFLENANIDRINVKKYNSLNLIGNSYIKNSEISLESHENARKYSEDIKKSLERESYISNRTGTLTLEDSTLTLNKMDSTPIYVNGNQITLKGKINLLFKGEGKEFSTSEYLGGIKVDGSQAKFEDTLVWAYRKKGNTDVVLSKNRYSDVNGNKNLNDFAEYLEAERNANKTNGDLDKVIGKMEMLKNKEDFNNALAQISGVVHSYVIDSVLQESELFKDLSLKKVFSRDITRNSPLNSVIHNIYYINDTGNLSGTIEAERKEKGIAGIWEKQIINDNKLGFIYGASKGDLNFKKNNAGNAHLETVYFGGYYNYNLNNKISFLTMVGTTYSHASIKREINIGNQNYKFNSSYPVITLGADSKIIYTPIEKNMFKVSVYGGIGFKRVFQGNINENREELPSQASNLTIKNSPVNEKYYNSVIPSIGINFEKAGLLFNKVYRFEIGAGYETETGNINKFKYYKLQGLNNEHKVKSANMKNVFYYNIDTVLGLTENLAITANYKHAKGKEYKSDKITLGFEYKGNVFKDNIFNSIITKLSNSRKNSRWKKTLGFTLEAEDPSDRAYYYGNILSSGDYSKSADYKPLVWLTLSDTKSKISYYFEGYYKNNSMFQGKSSREDIISSSRLMAEMRYRNTFSKGNYGFSIGYKIENLKKPKNYPKKDYYVSKSGFHELKLDGNISYNLGNGLYFTGKTTGMIDFYYKGERKNQVDYKVENQYGFVYNGFSPKWKLQLMYFRDDRRFDSKNNVRKYVSEQLRSSVIYNLGNGDSVTFDLRLPLGKGAWYETAETKERKSEVYEYRYGIKYNKGIVPGLNIFASLAISEIKVKNTDEKSSKYGEKTRNHVFKPSIGINYSF